MGTLPLSLVKTEADTLEHSTDAGHQYCRTVVNVGMNVVALVCDRKGGIVTTSYTAEPGAFSWPMPTALYSPVISALRSAAPYATATSLQVTSSPSATLQPALPSSSSGTATPTDQPTPSSRAIESPTAILHPPSGGLAGPAVGGITVGVLAGSACLALGSFLLYKWYRDHKKKAGLAGGGILPGPRRTLDPSPGSNGDGKPPGGALTASDLRDARETRTESLSSYQAYSTSQSPVPPSNARYAASPPRPTRPELPAAGLSAELEAARQHELSAASSAPYTVSEWPQSPTSPLYTPILLPNSPAFNTHPKERTPSEHLRSASNRDSVQAENWPLRTSLLGTHAAAGAKADGEQRRKSSQLLAVTGPYLSAEAARGEGYWAAEREQLEADKKVDDTGEAGMAEIPTEKRLEATANTRMEGDMVMPPEKCLEVNETGTLVRRRAKQ